MTRRYGSMKTLTPCAQAFIANKVRYASSRINAKDLMNASTFDMLNEIVAETAPDKPVNKTAIR